MFQYTATVEASGVALVQASHNIAVFSKAALCGAFAAAIAFSWLAWGEEVLGPLLIIVAAALYFSPAYLPMMLGQNTRQEGAQALEAIANVGLPVGIVGLLVLTLDVATRIKTRSREGAKADQIKYGKGLKEEKEINNIFLGKCWQLPYCRKFVRERCPIYHARRTCWKERVGCMCEESVIRNAMEGRVIPSDMVAAAKYIPVNNKLLPEQKAERCRQCVIYNEHQKHKYKLLLPVTILLFVAAYIVFHDPMAEGVKSLIAGVDVVLRKATLDQSSVAGNTEQTGLGAAGTSFHEVILIAILWLMGTYAIRFIEYVIFKLKL
ncbi:MAG: hypothetical protein KIT11_08325 [Fimbriimonadaceae bacterium]|nr:hypothetical protein [Fimbriimonadaceae bacterium]